MVDITNIKDVYLSCFEHPLALCLKALGKDYCMFFITSWNFSENFLINFTDTKSNIEMQLKLDAIERFLGIHFEFHKDKSNLIDRVKKEIDAKKTVIVHMDSAYCNWLTSYQSKMSTHHYFLIIGYVDNYFLCFDMKNDAPEKIAYDDFLKGCIECMFYNETNIKKEQISARNIYEYLSTFSSNEYQIYDNIKYFANYVKNQFTIDSVINGYEPFKYAPFFTWLKGICTSRMNYKRFLEIMIQKNIIKAECELVIEGLTEIYNKWYHVIMCFVRCVYCDDVEDKIYEIGNDIEEIAELEKIFLNILKDNLRKEY